MWFKGKQRGFKEKENAARVSDEIIYLIVLLSFFFVFLIYYFM